MTDLNTQTWMGDHKAILKNIPLCQVAMLGSHDSATTDISRKSKFGPDAAVKAGRWRFMPFSHIISSRWGRTQPLKVYDQLKAGVRYLDLRTCYLRDFEFFTAHTLLSRNLLLVIEQVYRFHIEHPSEFIILDFNHFYNMTKKEHAELIDFIHRQFNNSLVTEDYGPSVTCGKLWRTKKRIIVLYKYKAISREHDWLWGNQYICSTWPRAGHVNFLRKFLRHSLLHRNHEKFHVSQCVITPTVWLITRGILTLGLYPASLKRTETKLNRELLKSLQQLDKSYQQRINIVMIDWATSDFCAQFLAELITINEVKANKR